MAPAPVTTTTVPAIVYATALFSETQVDTRSHKEGAALEALMETGSAIERPNIQVKNGRTKKVAMPNSKNKMANKSWSDGVSKCSFVEVNDLRTADGECHCCNDQSWSFPWR